MNSKMTKTTKNRKTPTRIEFNVKLWNSFNTFLTYDEFVENYMDQWEEPEMNETDEEFEKRCLEQWKKIVDETGEDHEFDEEEDEDGDGDGRVGELMCELVYEMIADPRIEEYNKIVEKRLKREREERELMHKEEMRQKEIQNKEKEKKETLDALQKQISLLQEKMKSLMG